MAILNLGDVGFRVQRSRERLGERQQTDNRKARASSYFVFLFLSWKESEVLVPLQELSGKYWNVTKTFANICQQIFSLQQTSLNLTRYATRRDEKNRLIQLYGLIPVLPSESKANHQHRA